MHRVKREAEHGARGNESRQVGVSVRAKQDRRQIPKHVPLDCRQLKRKIQDGQHERRLNFLVKSFQGVGAIGPARVLVHHAFQRGTGFVVLNVVHVPLRLRDIRGLHLRIMHHAARVAGDVAGRQRGHARHAGSLHAADQFVHELLIGLLAWVQGRALVVLLLLLRRR